MSRDSSLERQDGPLDAGSLSDRLPGQTSSGPPRSGDERISTDTFHNLGLGFICVGGGKPTPLSFDRILYFKGI